MTDNVPKPLTRTYSSFRACLRAVEIEMYGDPCSTPDEVEFLFARINALTTQVIYVGTNNVGAPFYIYQRLTSRGLSYKVSLGLTMSELAQANTCPQGHTNL